MKHWIRNIVIVAFGLALIVGAAAWFTGRNEASAAAFRTAPVARGDILATITATGTVEPEDVIDVGAQVQGRITGFGKDKAGKSVDNNSEVEQGSVLALIDPLVYQSEVDSAEAQLKAAEAGVARAEADVGQFQAKFKQSERDWNRAQKLGPGDALPQVDYDAYESAYETAKANIAVGQAAVDQAKATVIQNQAALKRAKDNLGYCTITSPVTGVIITRRVNIGQTVVSSLSAPSLFLIAKDLTRVQLWTAVNEADIGNIHTGQDVTFTVDAYGARKFKGTVTKVRMDAQMTQNVVTYTVEITTDNTDRALIPYMTANVAFQVAKHDGVLVVPNAALRWAPSSADVVVPDARDQYLKEIGATGSRGSGGGASAKPAASAAGDPSTTAPTTQRARRGGDGSGSGSGQRTRGTLWIEDGVYVRPVKVRIGVTDNLNTEVIADELKEGEQVVLGEATAGSGASGDTKNPFAPQFRGRR